MNKLLERGSVFIHLDPRRVGVLVPPWLAKQPQLVLQIGLNFPVPIVDLEIDDEGVRCTLSFNRSPFYCSLPWSAVYALVSEDGQQTVWPSEIPVELVPRPEPAVRKQPPRERRDPEATRRARISVVPPPADERPAKSAAKTDDAERPTPVKPAKPAAARVETESDGDGNASPNESPPARSETRKPKERPPYLRLVK